MNSLRNKKIIFKQLSTTIHSGYYKELGQVVFSEDSTLEEIQIDVIPYFGTPAFLNLFIG